MFPQFIIYFSHNGLKYSAEVKLFEVDGSKIFDVYYSLLPITRPAVLLQIYSVSVNDRIVSWWERASRKEFIPENPLFIQAIGNAIQEHLL